MTIELPFPYSSYITPHFLPHESHLHILALGEHEERPRVRVYLWFLREEGILFEFSRIFISLKFMKWENFSIHENLNFSQNFQNTKNSFIELQYFSFIEPHETNFFIRDCKNLFSVKSHEIHLKIKWDLFIHDLEWKSYHIKSSSTFQFLVEFSSPVHDFRCSTILSSLWV